MKENFLKWLLCLLSLASFCVSAGERVNFNGIYYQLDDNSYTASVCVHPQFSYGGDVVISSVIEYNSHQYTVTAIEPGSFAYSKVTSAKLPNTILHIGKDAFRQCEIKNMEIPSSVLSIGERAFAANLNLESFYLSASVQEIGVAPLGGCRSLYEIKMDENNPYFVTKNGVLYDRDLTKIIQFPSGLYDYTNPPKTLQKIGEAAFQGSNLGYIDIPNTVTDIEKDAFQFCSRLKEIIIPASVQRIGLGAFDTCLDIKTIKSCITEPFECDQYLFYKDTYKNATLYVPIGTIEKYKKVFPWNKFGMMEWNSALDEELFDTDSETIIYNVNGVPVSGVLENLPKGIYVVKQGVKYSKIRI